MELRRLFCTVVAVIYMLVIKQQLDSNPLLLEALIGRRQSREGRSCDGDVTLRCLPRPERSGKQRVVLLKYSDPDRKQNFWMTHGCLGKLCVPVGGFMAPGEASSLCIMHAAVVLYRLCSCAEYISSPISCSVYTVQLSLSVDYKKV